jgi:restriction system protein
MFDIDGRLSVLVAVAIILFIIVQLRPRRKKRKSSNRKRKDYHKKMIFNASNRLNTLANIGLEGRRINYLKKVHHFEFEELILTAFELKGFKIYRNSRYTGDGGVDGAVDIDGCKTLIQAKRFRDHIRLSDVNDFIQECVARNVKGLFIHSGKTSDRIRHVIAETEHVQLVSGSKLLDLLDVSRHESTIVITNNGMT